MLLCDFTSIQIGHGGVFPQLASENYRTELPSALFFFAKLHSQLIVVLRYGSDAQDFLWEMCDYGFIVLDTSVAGSLVHPRLK